MLLNSVYYLIKIHKKYKPDALTPEKQKPCYIMLTFHCLIFGGLLLWKSSHIICRHESHTGQHYICSAAVDHMANLLQPKEASKMSFANGFNTLKVEATVK